MLIEGMTFRQRSAKHSYHEAQAWWCHAPPIDRPMIDHAARVKAGEKAFRDREHPGLD